MDAVVKREAQQKALQSVTAMQTRAFDMA